MLDSEETNTDRITIPQTENPQRIFSLEKDLTHTDWDNFIECLEETRETNVFGYSIIASCLKILKPNLEVSFNRIQKETFLERLGRALRSSDHLTAAKLARQYRIIDPTYPIEGFFIPIIETLCEEVRLEGTMLPEDAIEMASNLKIACPDLDLGINDTVIEMYQKAEISPVFLKILKPNIPLKLDWQSLFKGLNQVRAFAEKKKDNYTSTRWQNFIEEVYYLAILAAREISFDSNGMHLHFAEPKPVEKENDDRPVLPSY